MTGLEARKIDAVGVDLVPLRELSIVRDLVALLQARAIWVTAPRGWQCCALHGVG